jgi:hypothetical protein
MGIVLSVRFRCPPRYLIAESLRRLGGIDEALEQETATPLQQFARQWRRRQPLRIQFIALADDQRRRRPCLHRNRWRLAAGFRRFSAGRRIRAAAAATAAAAPAPPPRAPRAACLAALAGLRLVRCAARLDLVALDLVTPAIARLRLRWRLGGLVEVVVIGRRPACMGHGEGRL